MVHTMIQFRLLLSFTSFKCFKVGAYILCSPSTGTCINYLWQWAGWPISFRRPTQEPSSVACDNEQGDLFHFAGPHRNLHQSLVTMNRVNYFISQAHTGTCINHLWQWLGWPILFRRPFTETCINHLWQWPGWPISFCSPTQEPALAAPNARKN